MTNRPGINQNGKISRAKGQIHSGSVLLGLVTGIILTIGVITATAQSRLSAKNPVISPFRNEYSASLPAIENFLMI